MMVVRQADQWPGRQFDDIRSVLEVETGSTVGRVGVGRERDLAGARRQDHDALVVLDPNVTTAIEDALARYGRVPEAVGSDRTLVVGVVAGLLGFVGRREPALEGGIFCNSDGRGQKNRGGNRKSRSHGVDSPNGPRTPQLVL